MIPLTFSIVPIGTRVSAKNCTADAQAASKSDATYVVLGDGDGFGSM
jgi:hypothetical protein